MPEYSSTTITPADGVKTPAMNGSTSGNYTLSALRDFILASKGQANGLASLDANGKLPSSQIPDLADDVIVVASYATLPATGTAGKIYITADNNKMYRWDPDLETPNYVELSIDLSEYARIVDIQDGNIQAGVAVKAFQDAMGRAIITTYETKADASDLKDAISFNRKRIENLEQKSGSVVDVDYPEYSVYGEVPTGKAKNAIVSKLRGVSVAYNQQTKNGDFSDVSGGVVAYWAIGSNASMSVSNNVATLTPADSSISGNRFISNVNNNVISGHKYLVTITHKNESAFSVVLRKNYDAGNSVSATVPVSASSFSRTGYILNPSFTGDSCSLQVVFDGIPQVQVTDIFRHDLTQMFGPSVADYLYSIEQATTGAGVALFKALVSAQDKSHETGRLVSTTYESVGSRGKNLVKMRTTDSTQNMLSVTVNADGTLNAHGTPTANTTITIGGNGSELIDLIYLGGTFTMSLYNATYDASSFNVSIGYYEGNTLKFIIPNQTVTIPFGSRYNGFVLFVTSGNSVNVDNFTVQLERGSTATSYSPYDTLDTMPLPTSVTLRGILKVDNGNLVVDGDEYEPETGEIERKYNKITINASDITATSVGTNGQGYHYVKTNITASDALEQISADSSQYGITSNGFKVIRTGNYWGANDSISVTSSNGIFIISSFETVDEFKALCPITVVYQLATPTSDTPLDPVLDPTIKTEGGGTISTEQTNDPAIVSALEMTYMTL